MAMNSVDMNPKMVGLSIHREEMHFYDKVAIA